MYKQVRAMPTEASTPHTNAILPQQLAVITCTMLKLSKILEPKQRFHILLVHAPLDGCDNVVGVIATTKRET